MSNLQLEHFNVTGHSDFPFKFTLKGYADLDSTSVLQKA
nr:hypothetical protein [Escherichia coli]